MGAGVSCEETLTKEQAKELAGDEWDEGVFDSAAVDGVVTAAQFLFHANTSAAPNFNFVERQGPTTSEIVRMVRSGERTSVSFVEVSTTCSNNCWQTIADKHSPLALAA
jgi:hypothetical protein